MTEQQDQAGVTTFGWTKKLRDLTLTFSHGKTERSYSREFKIKAVELSKHRGNLQSVAAELDVPAKNPGRWKQEHVQCIQGRQERVLPPDGYRVAAQNAGQAGAAPRHARKRNRNGILGQQGAGTVALG